MEIQDLIGKRLKYKFEEDSFKTVEKVDDNFIHFSDKGRILKDKVFDSFEYEYENEIKPVITNPIINKQVIKENTNTMDNNIDNFVSNLGGLAAQIEAMKNGHSIPKVQDDWSDIRPSLTGSPQDLGQNYDLLSDDTRRQIEMQLKNPIQPVADPFFDQFSKDSNGGSVARYDVGGKLIKPNNSSNSNSYSNSVDSGGGLNDILNLPKMKKTLKVKLNIEMIEMIPKLEEIKVLESVFDFNLTERLAKDIVNKYINDRELFENMVISELEKHIKKQKKVVKKVVKKLIIKDKI